MSTSPFVVLLVSLSALAVVHGFICEIRLERRADALRDWVRQTHPGVWDGLPWHQRSLLGPRGPLKLIRNRRLIEDRVFAERCAELARLERRMLSSVAAAVFAIALVAIGTNLWGWSW